MVYDAIILGLGGMGSAALWHLAERGCNVLGIEQFGLAHDRGSSHGRSRLIRRAYFEHPDYVPLINRSYELWRRLEHTTGKKLFHQTGLFLAGPQPGTVIDGVLNTASRHRLDLEKVGSADAARRFPGLRAAPDMTVLFESKAGFLEVEECVRAQVNLALQLGAKAHFAESVRHWKIEPREVRVETDAGTYSARHLVLCCGAWSGQALKDLAIPLEVRRKVVVWYETADKYFRVDSGSPVFCFDTPEGFFYGFPTFDGLSIKVGEHSGGQPVANPDKIDREIHNSDLAPLARFIQTYLPAATTKVLEHSVCMYTMTPDEHFVIDRHPGYENVFLACGFSGHGFKFAPIIGSVLADFVTRGMTDEPVGFLSVSRFGLNSQSS